MKRVVIVFDTHHFECYKILHPEERLEDASYYILIENIKKHGNQKV